MQQHLLTRESFRTINKKYMLQQIQLFLHGGHYFLQTLFYSIPMFPLNIFYFFFVLIHQLLSLFLSTDIFIDCYNLIKLSLTFEQDLFCQQLIEYTSDCPYINRFCVQCATLQKFWCSVIQSSHLISHFDIFIPFYLFSHAQIDNLQLIALSIIKHYISRFQITMHDIVIVDTINSFNYLFYYQFGVVRS